MNPFSIIHPPFKKRRHSSKYSGKSGKKIKATVLCLRKDKILNLQISKSVIMSREKIIRNLDRNHVLLQSKKVRNN